MRLGQRAAEHGEIFGKGEHRPAVNGAPSGDHAVAGNSGLLHAELGRAVLDEHVELLERPLVHEKFQTLARGQFAALVLCVDAGFAPAGTRALPALFELFENVLHRLSATISRKINSMYRHSGVSFRATRG